MLSSNGKPIESAPPIVVPTLDAIAVNPALAMRLPREVLKALLLKSAAAQSALTAALITGGPEAAPQPVKLAPSEDRMLTPKEAAQLLRRSPRWIYRNAARLPFAKRVSPKTILCSEAGIKQWLTARLLN